MLLLFQRVESFVKASVRFGEPKPAVRRDHQPFEILDAALGALTPRWGKGGSPPVTRVELELPPIRIDESQVVEGLLALIENAIDATGSPARVRIHVHREPGGRGGAAQVKSLVRFDVQDDGPGIPESMLSRVFDPFFTTKPKGTGLGLPLAQALVRENGGRLEVRSVPGVETVFSVILPEASETP
jgi:signal transduction histidine kinase